MTESNIQIDDEYCQAMGKYFVDAGKEIEGFLNEYISILESMKKTSIKKGDVAEALEAYITYAKKILGQINNISSTAQQQNTSFLTAIDNADQYLF